MSIINTGSINKIKDWTTGNFKTYNFPHGKNLFNKNSVSADKIINVNGTESAAAGWAASDFIPVIPYSILVINNLNPSASAYLAFYDENKIFITGSAKTNNDVIAGAYKISVPQNAAYLRFANLNTFVNTTQLEYGEVATSYEAFTAVPTQPMLSGTQAVNVKNTVDVAVSNLLYSTGKNMFNKDTAVPNTIINASGTQISATGWYTSDFIGTKEGEKLIINLLNPSTAGYAAFYNESKTFIAGSTVSNTNLIAQGRILTAPTGAKFLRFTNLNTGATVPSLIQVERGTVSTAVESYIPYPTQPNFAAAQDVMVKNAIEAKVTNQTYPHGKNLFNNATATITKALNASGVEFIAGGWYVSDFIPVQPNSEIKLSGSYLGTDKYSAFYDKDKNFIPNSQVSASDLVANNLVLKSPANAAFLRFSAQTGIENIGLETMQVEYGKTTTRYEPYTGRMTTPNFTLPQDVKVVDGSPRLDGYSLISDRERYKIFKHQGGRRIVAIHENIVVAVKGASNGLAIGSTMYIGTNGVDGEYNYSLTFDSTNFPNLKAGSLIEEVMVLPFTRNMSIEQTGKQYRVCVITSNGQIYHNFPARATTSDGTVQSSDIIKFDESVVWDIKDRKFPSTNPSATGTEIYYPGLPATNYVYEPALSSDNGYGHGGFGKEITKGGVTYSRFYNPQKNTFHPFGFMGGFEPTKKLSVIGTYRSNSLREQGSRMCFFATSDGGRSWYNKYEFASLSGDNNAGVQIDTTSLAAYNADSFILKEVKHTIPSALNKEPDHLFDFGTSVVVTSITAGKPTVFTTAAAHGLVNNAVIVIQDNPASANASAEWSWLRNDLMTDNSGGNGMIFKIERLSDTTFALREYIHNPFNNIACRHIHSVNRVKDGFTMGCGEFYPHGWSFYIPTPKADDFSILNAWENLDFIRLTSTEESAKRSLGFTIKDDIDNTLIYSSDEAFVPRSNMTFPAGRTVTVKRSSTGVFKGKLSDVDDFTKFECVFEAQEPAFFFKEKSGVYIFCGQRGEAGFSFDGGETWIKDHFKEMVRYFRGQSNNLVLINDAFIYFK